MRTLYVTASTLNVRTEPSTTAKVVAQLAQGAEVSIVGDEADGWQQVRLGDGRVGWVATRFVTAEKVEARRRTRTGPAPKKRGGCDSDYAFVNPPTLSFSEQDAHGLVVVEANVNAKGVVTSTKVLRNDTGDPNAGAAAEREIRSAKFAPPMRNCVPRPFVFTYRRTF